MNFFWLNKTVYRQTYIVEPRTSWLGEEDRPERVFDRAVLYSNDTIID